MRSNGNLVETGPGGQTIFASGTNDSGTLGFSAALRPDGDFAVCDRQDTPIWSSGTGGHPGATLTLDNSGYLSLVEPGTGRVIWRGNSRMFPGQALTATTPDLYSPNGQFRLVMQDDGNLVEYDRNNKVKMALDVYNAPQPVVPSSPIPTNRGNKAVLQPDDNFVVYNTYGGVL